MSNETKRAELIRMSTIDLASLHEENARIMRITKLLMRDYEFGSKSTYRMYRDKLARLKSYQKIVKMELDSRQMKLF